MTTLLIISIATSILAPIGLCILYKKTISSMMTEKEIADLKKSPPQKNFYLSFLFIAIPQIVLYDTSSTQEKIIILLLGIVAYFDIIKKWIPDIAIFVFCAACFNLQSQMTPHDVAANITAFNLPLIFVEIVHLITKKKSGIGNGDFYITVPASLIFHNWYDAMLTSSLTILAINFFSIIKRKETPLIPFLFSITLIYLILK
ncbi:hypothetical protein HLB25_10380 [Dickeya dadantii]|uniref:hypothetical protein n=1 Tax=Dickeya dadantii TaxID=204038 RepID=UPI001495FDC9|nr:hypothetical protein [Dickeya dadantii]NPE55916.1 hypothetical protein [Dickeya dadantii]NPE67140.1 hypothetical protein [Dickeya dadantii]